MNPIKKLIWLFKKDPSINQRFRYDKDGITKIPVNKNEMRVGKEDDQ